MTYLTLGRPCPDCGGRGRFHTSANCPGGGGPERVYCPECGTDLAEAKGVTYEPYCSKACVLDRFGDDP